MSKTTHAAPRRAIHRQVQAPATAGALFGRQGTPFQLVAARGTDYQIGLAVGASLKAPIRGAWENWALRRMQEWFGTRPEQFADTARWLIDNLHPIAPWMIEQMRGIAAGSGLPFDHVVIMNHYAVLWSACGLFCTSLSVTRTDGGPVLIQNLDVGEEDLYFVSRIVPDHGHATLSDGMLGMCWSPTGVNDAGLAVGSSNLPAPAVSTEKPLLQGVPATHLPRMVLRNCRSTPEAVDYLRSLPPVAPRCSGYQLNLIDAAGNKAVVDKVADRVAVRQCSAGANFTTNISLDPELEAWRLGEDPQAETALHGQHRAVRLAQFADGLRDRTASVEELKALFRSHEGPGRICRHGPECHGGYSRLSMVYACRIRALEISNGPPCRNTYERYEM